MKFFSVNVVCVLGAVASVLGQTIEIGAPKAKAVLHPGKKFNAQIVEPESIEGCIQVGIALAIANCNKGTCPQPSEQLGTVLYAGPWKPTLHSPGGYYQDFSFTVPSYLTHGPAIFTLTHLCLIGAGPYPLLEFRNVSVTID